MWTLCHLCVAALRAFAFPLKFLHRAKLWIEKQFRATVTMNYVSAKCRPHCCILNQYRSCSDLFSALSLTPDAQNCFMSSSVYLSGSSFSSLPFNRRNEIWGCIRDLGIRANTSHFCRSQQVFICSFLQPIIAPVCPKRCQNTAIHYSFIR